MRRSFFIAFIGFAVLLPVMAMAADANLIQTDFPAAEGSAPVYGEGGKGPLAILVNFYQLALLMGGALAFAMVLYGAIKYMTAGGSHNTGSEAKSIITQAFLGLLLLAGAYFVLSIINPDLTTLQLPFMDRLKEPESSTGPINADIGDIPGVGEGNDWGCFLNVAGKQETKKCYPNEGACKSDCQNQLGIKDAANAIVNGAAGCAVLDSCRAASVGTSGDCRDHRLKYPGSKCVESPGVKAIVKCVTDAKGPTPSATIGGTHSINSCHFGGRTCTDGGHAIDYGIDSSAPKTLREVASIVSTCASATKNTVNCFYEDGSSGRKDASGALYAWNDPKVNHLHCNVNTATCGCN